MNTTTLSALSAEDRSAGIRSCEAETEAARPVEPWELPGTGEDDGEAMESLESDYALFHDFPSVEKPTEKTVFSINDERAAGWYLDKLAAIEAKRARIRAQAAVIIADLDADEKRLKDRFEWELELWGKLALSQQGGKKKFIDLLQGRIGFSVDPQSVSIADPAAAMAYALDFFPEAVEDVPATFKLNNKAYRDWYLQTGELLPGMATKPARESMSISFPKAGA